MNKWKIIEKKTLKESKYRSLEDEIRILRNEYYLYKNGESDTFEVNDIIYKLTKQNGSHGNTWILETLNTGFTKYFKDVFQVLDFLEKIA